MGSTAPGFQAEFHFVQDSASLQKWVYISLKKLLMIAVACLRTYWGQALSESFSFFSLLLIFWAEMGPVVTSLFSCSPLGSVDIPLSMMKTTPNSLSRSLRQSMSLTLHTGMTSLSLVSSYCSLNCNNHACTGAFCMHPPPSRHENAPSIMCRDPFKWTPVGTCISFGSNSHGSLFLQETN